MKETYTESFWHNRRFEICEIPESNMRIIMDTILEPFRVSRFQMGGKNIYEGGIDFDDINVQTYRTDVGLNLLPFLILGGAVALGGIIYAN